VLVLPFQTRAARGPERAHGVLATPAVEST
jgi:hypothetical protein